MSDGSDPVAEVLRTGSRLTFRRVRWGLIDQLLSSGTNFALAFLLVRRVDERSFGAFSLIVLIYVIAIGTLAAINSQPLIISSAGVPEQVSAGMSRALGVAASVGTLIGLACLLAAVFVSGPLRPLLVILGICLPLLLVQDAGRSLYFGLGRPQWAAANDAGWALSMGLALALLGRLDSLSLPAMVGVWLGSGALLGLAMIGQLKSIPAGLLASTRRLRRNLPLGSPLLGSYLLTIAPSYLVFAIAPALAGLGELGLARAAYLPFAAFGVLLQGGSLLLLPALAGKAAAQARDTAGRATLAMAGGAVVWTSLILFGVPDAIGELILGHSWQRTETLRALFGVALIAQTLGLGAVIALSSLTPGRLLRLRLMTGPVSFVLGIGLTFYAGAIGLAMGIVLGDVLTAVGAWLVLRKLPREPADR